MKKEEEKKKQLLQLQRKEARLCGEEPDLGVFALARVVNDLAAAGIKAAEADVSFRIPGPAHAAAQQEMISRLEQAADAQGVRIQHVRTQVCPADAKPAVHVSGTGAAGAGKAVRGESVQSGLGEAIVLLKWIGLEGTLRILHGKAALLHKRFVPAFLRPLEELKMQLFSGRELLAARAFGALEIWPITEGGILAALWEMAERLRVGLEADMGKMTIRQETVEICECFRLNPYRLTSAGSALIVTERGEELAAAFEREGIPASVLGRTTKGPAKVIFHDGIKRFLDRPAPDELFKIYDTL